MDIIKKILTSDFFVNHPPVLIDIGASGEINPKWKRIAPYAVCIAFDADEREFSITEQTDKTYKKLIKFNRIVTAQPVKSANFYLTSSPFCSSLLKPENHKLECWVFSSLFAVESHMQLPAMTVREALEEVNIDYIDWFKTDTQGTDLRLFETLPPSVASQVLVAEFEPGIIDAYAGEDKLYSVLGQMPEKGFWLSSMDVKGVQRLNKDYLPEIGSLTANYVIRRSPGWAEVSYLRQPFQGSERQLLLLYVFALLERQYGFALEVIEYAMKKYSDKIFTECRLAVLKKIRSGKFNIPLVILKRRFNNFFANIND